MIMNTIVPIKKIYNDPTVQDDLTLDSITLFTNNISGNFYRFNGKTMDKVNIDKLVGFFKDKLYEYNDIDVEWDQTS